jgi:hypothetical protein
MTILAEAEVGSRYVDEMQDLEMLPETFEGCRPGYSADRLPLLTVYAQL